MGGAIQSCNLKPKDPCDEILKKINEYMNRNKKEIDGRGTHGLTHRFRELISALSNGDISRYKTHADEIRYQQVNLQKELNKYDKNKCGPPPPGAWSLSERRVPTPSDYGIEVKPSAIMTGIGVGIGGYVLYRAIRFLPSLLPPLWPTIPANLAVP